MSYVNCFPRWVEEPPPWTMTESGFIRCPREYFAESPIFMEVATEHNGILFADLCKRSWE